MWDLDWQRPKVNAKAKMWQTLTFVTMRKSEINKQIKANIK